MKKIILSVAVILSITATSCRKERTCECKTTETQVRSGGSTGTYVDNSSTKVTKEKQKKKSFKATEECYSKSYTYTGEGGFGTGAYTYVTTVETKCELD